MRPTALSTFVISTVSVIAMMALGACAGSRTASNPCLDKCTRVDSSLERETCELECKQTASAPAPTPTTTPSAPPAVSDPGQPQPAQSTPAPAGPKQYAGDTGQRQAPPGAVRPTPARGATTPSTPPGPSMAELQAQRSQCESTCDADARPSDRSTCRLQCAQITDRPANTAIPPSSSPSTGGSRGSGTTQPAPADRGSIAACEAGCNSESTPATDRATCRLNCNAVGTTGPAPSSYNVLHGNAPAGTNRANVIRSSGGVVPQSSPPPAMTPADAQKAAQCASQAQQCSSTCSTRQEPCNRGCDDGKLSATDRATCKLTCDSNIDVCRDDCRIQEGTCRGPTVRK